MQTIFKILIVEDNKRYGEFIANALKDENYEVKITCTAQEALKQIKKENFNLIITDVKMPEKNGIELLDEIKVYDKNLNVIVITGYGNKELESLVFKKGGSGYLEKPFNLTDFILTVENTLKEKN